MQHMWAIPVARVATSAIVVGCRQLFPLVSIHPQICVSNLLCICISCVVCNCFLSHSSFSLNLITQPITLVLRHHSCDNFTFVSVSLRTYYSFKITHVQVLASPLVTHCCLYGISLPSSILTVLKVSVHWPAGIVSPIVVGQLFDITTRSFHPDHSDNMYLGQLKTSENEAWPILYWKANTIKYGVVFHRTVLMISCWKSD